MANFCTRILACFFFLSIFLSHLHGSPPLDAEDPGIAPTTVKLSSSGGGSGGSGGSRSGGGAGGGGSRSGRGWTGSSSGRPYVIPVGGGSQRGRTHGAASRSSDAPSLLSTVFVAVALGAAISRIIR